MYAVVEVTQRITECSGAGGEHYVLAIDEPGQPRPRLAHAGGHAVYLGLLPTFANEQPASRHYVAELVMRARGSEDNDGNPDSSRKGWCLDGLPEFDAIAYRLVRARDRTDAHRLLARIQHTGMAPPTTTIAPATGSETIGVARVTGAVNYQFTLQPIAGDVPTSIEWPKGPGALPQIGDALVVASAAGNLTRAFVADDVTTARRWADRIATHGWPPEPIVTSHVSVTTARWIAIATITHDACGLAITATSGGYGSNLIIEPMIAPAPPGVHEGERVLAMLMARVEPDACGRTMRAVRVYRTPADFDASRWYDHLRRGMPLVSE